MYKKKINKTRITVETGNALQAKVDVLFNWTIPTLSGGNDIFMAIHKDGGSSIFKECQGALTAFGQLTTNKTLEIPVGKAVITSAGILTPSKLVHTVIPNYRIAEQKANRLAMLTQAIKYSFVLIKEYDNTSYPIKRIAITPIPSLIYGQVDRATIKQTVATLLECVNKMQLRELKFVCKNEEETLLYSNEFIKQTSTWWERIVTKILG